MRFLRIKNAPLLLVLANEVVSDVHPNDLRANALRILGQKRGKSMAVGEIENVIDEYNRRVTALDQKKYGMFAVTSSYDNILFGLLCEISTGSIDHVETNKCRTIEKGSEKLVEARRDIGNILRAAHGGDKLTDSIHGRWGHEAVTSVGHGFIPSEGTAPSGAFVRKRVPIEDVSGDDDSSSGGGDGGFESIKARFESMEAEEGFDIETVRSLKSAIEKLRDSDRREEIESILSKAEILEEIEKLGHGVTSDNASERLERLGQIVDASVPGSIVHKRANFIRRKVAFESGRLSTKSRGGRRRDSSGSSSSADSASFGARVNPSFGLGSSGREWFIDDVSMPMAPEDQAVRAVPREWIRGLSPKSRDVLRRAMTQHRTSSSTAGNATSKKEEEDEITVSFGAPRRGKRPVIEVLSSDDDEGGSLSVSEGESPSSNISLSPNPPAEVLGRPRSAIERNFAFLGSDRSPRTGNVMSVQRSSRPAADP